MHCINILENYEYQTKSKNNLIYKKYKDKNDKSFIVKNIETVGFILRKNNGKKKKKRK